MITLEESVYIAVHHAKGGLPFGLIGRITLKNNHS